jgi:Transglycosylase SLT domain
MNELPNTEGLGMKVRTFQVLCFIVAAGLIAVGLVAIHSNATEDTLSATPNAIATANIDEQPPRSSAPSAMSDALPQRESLLSNDQRADFDAREQKADVDSQGRHEAKLEDTLQEYPSDSTLRKQDFSYLAYYAYAEVLPDKKPADTVLEALKGIPVGAPVEEIKRVSDAFGLDFVFMRAVAKIESDFDPKQRTGSYIGLFQLSKREFEKYGSGNITDPRDNAVAAAYKLSVEAKLFELDTHKKATLSDIYLVHQQGVQGAAEHVNHPERIAWESMCATDEGREKGKKWCKRAIWGNTLPTIKHIWKSVTKLTSGAFVAMWHQRVDHFYARYSEANTEKKDR